MKTAEYPHTNRLIYETSPYLLQHAHNPVDWYPWGVEAFEKAKKENKLVLVSIGYAACHWCHVMEHESFENEVVANYMNEHFVCIKVDREQRPDVDHQYMDAVQLLSGHGGWPLNCFALPDGRPVWGGTYFNRQQWMSVLKQLATLYKEEPEKMVSQARQLAEGMTQSNVISLPAEDSVFSSSDLDRAVDEWSNRFDFRWGGNRGAPKFPMPSNYIFLLNRYHHTNDAGLLKYLKISLDRMANGGIYDPLGGGFARYSTDSQWKVPHFEKMLYDNAQLLSVYAQAYQLTRRPLYKEVVYGIVDFMRRELQAPTGGFYASIDADSEGEEGRFYVFTKAEIDQLLANEAPLFEAFYSITEKGNWEDGKNVLFVQKPLEEVAAAMGIPVEEAIKSLASSRKKLFEYRSHRQRPMTDTKVITSWNALAISGLCAAYEAFGDEQYIDLAQKTASFIQAHRLNGDGHLVRAKKNDTEFIPAFLDDFALTAQAFIDLYRADFNASHLEFAKQLTDYSLSRFYDSHSGMFNYAAKGEGPSLIKKREITDNVIPASNSSMARVLYQLGVYFESDDYSRLSGEMLRKVYPLLLKQLPYFSNWAFLLNRHLYPAKEVVITGPEALALRKALSAHYLSEILAGSTKESTRPLLQNRFIAGEDLIYVCENKVCKLPVKSISEALKSLE